MRNIFVVGAILCFFTISVPFASAKNNMLFPSHRDMNSKAYSYRNDVSEQKMQSLVNKEMESMRRYSPCQYVAKVVSVINASSENDFEKAKMAHDIIALTVSYDAASYLSGQIPAQDFESVLSRGTAVCEGFANTFKEFCDELGIKCKIVHGYARGKSSSLAGESEGSVRSNHAWNIVKIKGNKYLVDCTWDEGYMNGSAATKDYRTHWLFSTPETFIYTHFPDDKDGQLLSPKVSKKNFVLLPYLRPNFFDAVQSCSYEIERINSCKGTMDIEFKMNESYSLSASVFSLKTNDYVKGSWKVAVNDGVAVLNLIFPDAGRYKVNLFAKKEDDKKAYWCGEFIVTNEMY